jgi:hypothetical protein
MPKALSVVIGVAVLALAGAPAFAQAPTGIISGHVVSADGQPLPGVTVSATAPTLQGNREAVTSLNGDYIIPLLPPGTYTVTFQIGDFEPIKESRTVAGTQTAILDVKMAPASVAETVNVVAEAQPFVETANVAINFKQNLMAALPSNRTLDAVLLMSPSLHASGPRGAYTINGAQSYENLFTLDGAVITENLRGAPFTLYIEDAIQETTVASAGVSAEYGRFSGGVANAITKSGGNNFSGSFRTSFANDSWRSYSPFESTQLISNPALKLKVDKTVPTYEMTMGGPVKRDKLWFFGAARKQNQESSRTTVGTNLPYVRNNDEKRYEGKLTYSPRMGHSLQGSVLVMDQILRNNTGSNVMDLASLTNQGQPQDLYSAHYTGVISKNFFLEAQYSARHLSFTEVGAKTTDLIDGTLVLDLVRGFRYWSPTFCSGSVCDGDEERNNSDFIVKGSYFLSDRKSGSHHVVFGYDRFNDNIWANTHASGSDYRIRGTTSILRDGVVYPQFLVGTSSTSTQIEYDPLEVLSDGSNLRTHSLFVNDNWRANNNFTFNVGLRLDKNDATDGGGQKVGQGFNLSPRVSAIWDPTATGTWSATGSYARYVMALTSNLAGSTTQAGNASAFRWFYGGAPINPDATVPTSQLVSTRDALAQVFAWFKAAGGIDIRPYALANVPGVNMKIREPLTSPYADEFAGGISRTLGNKGSARMDVVRRLYNNFYSLRTDMSTGRVTDRFGTPFDLSIVENTNATERKYIGLVTQASYQFSANLLLGGNYTLSHTTGNLEGETVAGGPSGADINSYPEYKRVEWNAPQGSLLIDQRHRARMWGTYTVPGTGAAGGLTVGFVQQIASGIPYPAATAVSTVGLVQNPGYVTPPAAVNYYFTARDAFHLDNTYRTDISVNYAYRLPMSSSAPELFFHGEVLNVFNQFQLCGCGDTVFNNGGVSNLTTIGQSVTLLPTRFNPYTETPVQGVNWDKGANFGQPLNAFAFTSPRIFRFSVGVRF